MPLDWRLAALSGATAGLGLAPLAPGAAPWRAWLLVLVPAAVVATTRPSGRSSHLARLAVVALLGAFGGLIGGSERLAAIDAGAMRVAPGSRADVTGFVVAVPRRSHGTVRVQVRAPQGRILLEAPEPVPDIAIGAEVEARGPIRPPPDYYRSYLRRNGIAEILAGGRIRLTGRHRGGLASVTDGIRQRSQRALERGMPKPESALARGMVLGQDDRIDSRTIDDFKRSGLAHLLAVSGQNVVLLAILAMPLLAATGLMLRGRLICILVLIAIYVPVTGAGPSIQRAGAMGAAGVIAALAGRPRSRWYAVLLAAFATLAVNPRASGDVGWQLSFAAVLGILLWTPGLRRLASRLIGPGQLRGALAEGAAMTVAATLATAPLMAAHFERFSLASLPANLLAMPAVAPAMWLGMLSAAAGQLPAIPVEPLNAITSVLVAYIAQVGRWFATPGWAVVSIRLTSPVAVAAAYALLAAGMWLLGAPLLRRAYPRPAGAARRLRRPAPFAIAAVAALGAFASAVWAAGIAPGATPNRHGLQVSVLDVGQGDAILFQPPRADAVLVDGGPPGDGLRAKLQDSGVKRLAAVIATHDQADHVGGLEDLLGTMPIEAVDYAEPARRLLREAAVAGARPEQLAEGSEVRSGLLDIEVLWPPRQVIAGGGLHPGGVPPDDPNLHALVLLARWRSFSILLTADAEAEAVPIDPGPVDVLKVAHHGSEDMGLDGLLARTAPKLAVISVGAGNPYGHPTAQTLATLERHHVPTLRTDRDGTVRIKVDRSSSVAVTP